MSCAEGDTAPAVLLPVGSGAGHPVRISISGKIFFCTCRVNEEYSQGPPNLQ